MDEYEIWKPILSWLLLILGGKRKEKTQSITISGSYAPNSGKRGSKSEKPSQYTQYWQISDLHTFNEADGR